MALFDKFKFEKLGLDALAAAGKAASMLGDKIEQTQRDLAPKLNDLKERAAPHLNDLKERATPHLDNLKNKATEFAADVKEAVVGPALDTFNVYDLKNMYQSDAININLALQHLKIDGMAYELEVDDGPYMVLYQHEGGFRKQVNKLDTISMSSAQRSEVLQLVNMVNHANDVAITVRQKEPNTVWPDLHKLMPMAQFKSNNAFKPQDPTEPSM